MSLQEELDRFKSEFTRKLPADKAHIMDEADRALAATDLVERALKVGDIAPDFHLPDATGRTVGLYETLAQGPVILIFYRGGWCPYCNLELRAYQRLLPEIRRAGAHLLAVTPEKPDDTLTTQEKNSLVFPVLSDITHSVSRSLGILFELPVPLQELYSRFGHALTEVNASGEWMLPVPATYVIDRNGKILARHLDTDYRVRMEPTDALAALPRSVEVK